MKPDSMDAVFLALAHPHRRRMLDLIQNMPGCSVGDVAKYFACSRIMVMKHLKVLTKAKLLISRKTGRRRELFFNAVPIQAIYDRWTTDYSRFWAAKALDLKYMLESRQQKADSCPP